MRWMPSAPHRPAQAMVLAAGQGMRLRPLTERMPKCMVRLGGKPLLEHGIRWLRKHGITSLAINLSHLPETVTEYFGDGQRWGVRITYSFEQAPLGTAGGVKRIASFFQGPFFVWYGDNLSTCRLDRLWEHHQSRGGVATIALHYREDPTHGGIVALDGRDRITRFLEKPAASDVFSHWVNAGIYAFEPSVLNEIPAGEATDFGREIFPAMLTAGSALYGYRMSGDERLWWIDRPEDLHRLERMWETIEPRLGESP
jgi:NDP-sugar pyrophosphorylase family protein